MPRMQGFHPPTRRSILFAPSRGAGAGGSEHTRFWMRAAAAALDLLIVLLAFGSWMAAGVLIEDSYDVSDLLTPWIIASSITVVLVAIGFWVLTALRGQTFGKMILGLKVVNEMGEPPGFSVALLREAVGKFWIPISIIGFITAAWDRERQALHDHLAHTYVVRSR